MPRNVVDVPLFTLNDGNKVPSIGLGCWLGSMEASLRAEEVCKKALAVRYRHFDTAAVYGSERGIGAAVRGSDILRDELYIVTKLWNDCHHNVREAFEKSLEALGSGYIDLYLMHWPQAKIDGKTLHPEEHPTFIDTWKEMEKLLETGKVKSIGVSNFSIKTLAELFPHCQVVPAVNQVQFHPYLPQFDLQEFCKAHGILLSAYSPLGAPPSKHGVEPAQVVLSWSVRHGVAVIPKSQSEVRMRTNLTPVDLDDADMKAIDDLHKEPGKHRSLMIKVDGPRRLLGWEFISKGLFKMPSSAADVPFFTLNDGNQIPSIGLGCWLGAAEASNPSDRAEQMAKKALAVGYRHFDTAAKYGGEQGLGAAIRDSGVPREELYIVTKLWNEDHHKVHEAFEESLANLGCGYIDLYLMHWPQATLDGETLPPGEHPTFIDTWKEIEKLLETGKVKSIGVSNFSVMTLTELLPHCKVVPTDRVSPVSPASRPPGVVDIYARAPPSPDEPTRLSLLTDSTITAIAKKHAQVLLSWSVRHGIAVIPKSESEARMRTNIALIDLDETDMKAIDNLHKEPGKHRSLLTQYMTVPLEIMGWKYEWLGWNQAADGAILE
ncbi:hypothetical protein EVG20_g60 [Dentipellis fragilis]|uniref:NADP-dependent oxidoreductase domain-containing protein n=1 Tax=Dentipellis fragilis TaxID=205917 RepID=A0A4Y9ZDT8_9AGAM|nr:hypothetical protein EVG20_g60 [Dentipellis fragilis]